MKKHSFTKFMLIIAILILPLYLRASELNTIKDFNKFYEEIINLQSQLNGIAQSLYISDLKDESLTSLQKNLSVYNTQIKTLNSKLFDYATNSTISSIDRIRLEALIIATRLLNDLNLVLNELLLNEDYELEYKLFKSFFAADALLTQSISSFPLEAP